MRFLVWTGVEEWLTESAAVELGERRPEREGHAAGCRPRPLSGRLPARGAADFVTQRARADRDGGGLAQAAAARARRRGWLATRTSTTRGMSPAARGTARCPTSRRRSTSTSRTRRSPTRCRSCAHGFQRGGTRRLPDGLRHDPDPARRGLTAALRARARDARTARSSATSAGTATSPPSSSSTRTACCVFYPAPGEAGWSRD